MAEIVNSRYQGILIPDGRFSADNLTEDDHASAPSSYTQAGPKPGVPEAQQSTRMVLQTSGSQSALGCIEIESIRAGHPGLERAGFIWSDDEAETDKFGWDGPQLLSGWDTLFWSDDSTEKSARPDIARLNSGKLLALGLQDKTSFAQTVKIYDPDAASNNWSTAGTITLDTSSEQKGPALCVLPSDRVLAFIASGAQVDVYFSDDDGANWAAYSFRCLDDAVGNADIREMRAAYSNGEVLLLVQFTDGAGKDNLAQYASDDLGGMFIQVEDDWVSSESEEVLAISLTEIEGAFLFAYHSDPAAGANKYISRRVSSAFDRLEAAEKVEIRNGMVTLAPACSIYRDDTGVVFALVSRDVSDDDLHAVRSDDGGLTWEEFSEAAFFSGSSSDAHLISFAAESVAGRTVVLTRWDADTSNEDPQSLGVIYLGGSSTHSAPAKDGAVDFVDTDYVSFNKNTSSAAGGGAYLPIVAPRDVGWTDTGVGTDDLVDSHLEITTAANQRYFSRTLSSGNEEERLFAEFSVRVESGGSVSTQDVAFVARIGDTATFDYEIAINLKTSGFALYDRNSSSQIGSTVSIDITKTLNIRIAMDKGNVKTWYARPDHYREWTEGPGGAVSNGGSGGNSLVLFGHAATASATSSWAMVGYCFWPGRWSPISSGFADVWSTPDDLHPRSYSVSPTGVFDGVRIGAVSGPTRHNEQWFIEADYDYPAEHLLPATNANPRAAWRSTNELENIFAWDISGLANAHVENPCFGVVLLGINFKTAVLERKTGGVWTTVCTINAAEGFESLRFARDGGAVYPETGGSAHKAGRYIQYQELEGGTFVDSTNAKYRKIGNNSEGAWTDEGAKYPTVWIDGADDSEATSGDCEIWAPNAAGIAHSLPDPDQRYWRLRIPAQTTADGYFEIGQMLIGPIAIFGTQYGRGRQVVTRHNSEIFTLDNGTTRARSQGPVSREIEFAWVDGIDQSQINKTDPVPDFVAGSVAGGGIASVKDSIYLMRGLIARQKGPVSPVVYFSRIAADSTDDQTNNPREFIYGRIISDHSRQNILGDEEKTDVDRLGTITIQEIV